jgi:hypothetical protein
MRNVTYSAFRASRPDRKMQKTPWIATQKTGEIVRHSYHTTERQAREAVGLTGGSESLGPPKETR